MSSRSSVYTSPVWNVVEYLSLFAIVLMHEFGHSLACRQVGGRADQIVLWPLGGVAYVDPPQRPGATLWSIAAGPLVNVALFPVLYLLAWLSRNLDWSESVPNLGELLRALQFINLALLIFNLLPIYPLDGGQIVRSMLWFVLGRARSLLVASIIGFVGVAGLIVVALWARSVWFGILSAFILMNCWSGLMQARALARIARLPRHGGFVCPSCEMPPPRGEFWICGQCQIRFDTFATRGVCLQCGTRFEVTRCLDCGRSHPMDDWLTSPPVQSRL